MALTAFGPLNGFLLLLTLFILAVDLFALIDAVIRPAPLYVAVSKQTKVFWVVILVLAVIFSGLGFLGIAGLIAAIVYLVDVRPVLREAAGGRGPQGGWRT